MEKEVLNRRKEMMLALFNDRHYKPLKLKELAMLLDISKEERAELKEVLDSLLDEGKISISNKGKYGSAGTFALTGMYTGNKKGFGFVTVEGMEEDIFIPEENVFNALHGDKVQIVITKDGGEGKRKEGRVVKVLEHTVKEVVGYYSDNKTFGFVVPDNQKITRDIFVKKEDSLGAVKGHKVVVRITDYGDAKRKPEGKIIEILGHVNDPGVDIMSIVKAYGYETEFPKEVMKQVSQIPDEVDEASKEGRLDLRGLMTVTIDGEDAKDLDDAITISKADGIYTLGVHIADVSNYVKEGSTLDREALKRATSVYLVDRVIPMLPHKLSNGICSLNAGTDRLAFSCIMEIDSTGNVIGHNIAETVINVDRRMSYTSVKKILDDKDEDECREYKDFVPMFELMKELSDILREKRKKRGSIDFDLPESKIILDKKGKPVDIEPYERNTATKIIEDFMLMANETVAEDYYWQELPFVYRTHEDPDPEKIKKLSMLINNFGYNIRTGNNAVHPKEIQKLLCRIENSPEEVMISRLTLRSMKRARYSTECEGHFGLAAKYYCHFTSPIRRYPDLQIHRIMKENLHKGLSERRIEHYNKILPDVASLSSLMERQADEAERDTEKLKKCQYMSSRIGQKFEGIISGITAWGMYVELPNTVEGLVHISELKDDYYYFDEEHYEMVGERLHKHYVLGQKVRVELLSVDRIANTIDFAIAYEDE